MPEDGSDGDDEFQPFDSGSIEEGSRSVEVVVALLSNERTRYVLQYLESVSSDVVELDDLVDYVVEQETDERTGEPEEHRQQVAIALHHNRLPKLADEAVIDYDPRSNTVRYWGDGQIRAVLDLFDTGAL